MGVQKTPQIKTIYFRRVVPCSIAERALLAPGGGCFGPHFFAHLRLHPNIADDLARRIAQSSHEETVPERRPAGLVVFQAHRHVAAGFDALADFVHCPLVRFRALQKAAISSQDLFTRNKKYVK